MLFLMKMVKFSTSIIGVLEEWRNIMNRSVKGHKNKQYFMSPCGSSKGHVQGVVGLLTNLTPPSFSGTPSTSPPPLLFFLILLLLILLFFLCLFLLRIFLLLLQPLMSTEYQLRRWNLSLSLWLIGEWHVISSNRKSNNRVHSFLV